MSLSNRRVVLTCALLLAVGCNKTSAPAPQPARKFKTRYATLGFNDPAQLDDGAMWPIAFALTELTAAEEARIGALVKKAVS